MEQSGYVCSFYCRQQAEARHLSIPVYANQTSYKLEQSKKNVQRSLTAAVVFVVLGLSLWIWYAFFARNPTVVFTVNTPVPESRKIYIPKEFYRLIGPDQLLRINTNKLTMLNVLAKTDAWSVDLPKSEKSGGTNAALFDDDDFYFSPPELSVTPSDIWMWFPDRLLRVDRKTGAIKSPITGRIVSVRPSETALLVVSRNLTNEGMTLLTRIALPDGSQESEEIQPESKAAPTNAVAASSPAGPKRADAPGAAGKVLAKTVDKSSFEISPWLSYFDDQSYSPAGASVVHFQKELLETKYIEHQAMKAKGKAVVDSGNLTAAQSMDAANEIFNDMQRQATGGVEREDVSRYKVTIHRHFVKDVPDWSGEVDGPPQLFVLKTVDLIGGGHTLVVIDKNDKKLWDSKLTYSARPHSDEMREYKPCLETRDSLYFADEGILARFDLKTGAPRWRLNSVGVSRIQEDGHGAIYVNTTTAGPEDLRFSQQVNVMKRIDPVVIKVDVATGQVLWRVPFVADECVLTHKFVYTSHVSQAYELLNLEDGPKARYNLNLLSPSSGTPIWNYHQNNQKLLRMEACDNWIMVHFQEKLVVLKFFSL